MFVRIPPPIVFALVLGIGLLLNLPHMERERERAQTEKNETADWVALR